jgi:hypothetical protein
MLARSLLGSLLVLFAVGPHDATVATAPLCPDARYVVTTPGDLELAGSTTPPLLAVTQREALLSTRCEPVRALGTWGGAPPRARAAGPQSRRSPGTRQWSRSRERTTPISPWPRPSKRSPSAEPA